MLSSRRPPLPAASTRPRSSVSCRPCSPSLRSGSKRGSPIARSSLILRFGAIIPRFAPQSVSRLLPLHQRLTVGAGRRRVTTYPGERQRHRAGCGRACRSAARREIPMARVIADSAAQSPGARRAARMAGRPCRPPEQTQRHKRTRVDLPDRRATVRALDQQDRHRCDGPGGHRGIRARPAPHRRHPSRARSRARCRPGRRHSGTRRHQHHAPLRPLRPRAAPCRSRNLAD
jgi:hypothetical protein